MIETVLSSEMFGKLLPDYTKFMSKMTILFIFLMLQILNFDLLLWWPRVHIVDIIFKEEAIML
jgi:hypothetical protein